MERIGEDVARTLADLGPGSAMVDIVRVWPGAVGDVVARHAWPARIARDGTLHVATSSSTWSLELTLLQHMMLERLRAALGDSAPTRLRFAPGLVPDLRTLHDTAVRAHVLEPGAAERLRAAEVTAVIEDPELRATVARAAAASLAQAVSDRAV